MGYHSPKKIHNSDMIYKKCEYLDKKCYYSIISFVEGERLLKLLITRGEEVVFEELGKIYCKIFKGDKI